MYMYMYMDWVKEPARHGFTHLVSLIGANPDVSQKVQYMNQTYERHCVILSCI